VKADGKSEIAVLVSRLPLADAPELLIFQIVRTSRVAGSSEHP
jgi:hypothetical protein